MLTNKELIAKLEKMVKADVRRGATYSVAEHALDYIRELERQAGQRPEAIINWPRSTAIFTAPFSSARPRAADLATALRHGCVNAR